MSIKQQEGDKCPACQVRKVGLGGGEEFVSFEHNSKQHKIHQDKIRTRDKVVE